MALLVVIQTVRSWLLQQKETDQFHGRQYRHKAQVETALYSIRGGAMVTIMTLRYLLWQSNTQQCPICQFIGMKKRDSDWNGRNRETSYAPTTRSERQF